jgi:hypothetical protein
MNMLPVVTDSPWQVIDKSKDKKNVATPAASTSFIPAHGSVPVINKKHKLDNENDNDQLVKKQKTVANDLMEMTGPVGLQWDGENYSCAYDSLFSILYDIWKDDPRSWSAKFNRINNRFLGTLGKGFNKVLQEKATLEEVRDVIRKKLHNMNGEKYPYGKAGATVGYLAVDMLKSNQHVSLSQVMCSECEYAEPENPEQHGFVLLASHLTPKSTSEWISKIEIPISAECPSCSSALTQPIFYHQVPQILICEYPQMDIKTSHKIVFATDKEDIILYLRGIVYHGGFHFTSRIISSEGDIWFHDGIDTGRNSENDGHMSCISDIQLRTCRGKDLVLAIYAQ